MPADSGIAVIKQTCLSHQNLSGSAFLRRASIEADRAGYFI